MQIRGRSTGVKKRFCGKSAEITKKRLVDFPASATVS